MLRCVGWWLVTDVSGQYIGPIFKGKADHFFLTALPSFQLGSPCFNGKQKILTGDMLLANS
jgi:hypothetical protein